MTSKRNYYEILQVSEFAEQEVISAAYKRLAQKYHPDLNKSVDTTQKMQEINAAYNILNDPEKRAEYDKTFKYRKVSSPSRDEVDELRHRSEEEKRKRDEAENARQRVEQENEILREHAEDEKRKRYEAENARQRVELENEAYKKYVEEERLRREHVEKDLSIESIRVKSILITLILFVVFIVSGIIIIGVNPVSSTSQTDNKVTITNTPTLILKPMQIETSNAFHSTNTPVPWVDNFSASLQPSDETNSLPPKQIKIGTPKAFHPTNTPMPKMDNFSACLQLCDGANSRQRFPEGTTKIYIQWNYENIPYGASYERVWRMNGKEWIRYSCTWTGSKNGKDSVQLTEPYGLHSGIWEMTVYINGDIIINGRIELLGNHQYWDPAGTINKCYGTVD